MFTGIIQSLGTIASIDQKGGDISLIINTAGLDMDGSEPGDSIAVNGVCLTAVSYPTGQFVADVSIPRRMYRSVIPCPLPLWW